MDEKDEKPVGNTRAEATPNGITKVSIKKAHRHAGRDWNAGEEISVPSSKLEYLKQKGVI